MLGKCACPASARNNPSTPSIAPAASEYKHLEEGVPRREHCPRRFEGMARFRERGRHDPGIFHLRFEVILQRFEGIVQQVAFDPPGPALHLELVVRVQSAPKSVSTPHNPQAPLRIPGVPDPFPEIKVQAVHKETLFRRRAVSQQPPQCPGQLGRNRLIGIQAQHPRLGASAQRNVLLLHMAAPGMDFEDGIEMPGDRSRSILGTRIDDHDLRNQPAQAFKTARQIVFLVQRNDGGRERQRTAGDRIRPIRDRRIRGLEA